MTTLFMDPFATYGSNTGNMLAGPYAEVGSQFALTTVPWATDGITSLSSTEEFFGTSNCRRVLSTTKTALISSFRWGVNALPTADGTLAVYRWLTSGNTLIATLMCGANGRIYLINASGTEIATTVGPVIVPANLHHFECKLDVSAGTFILRMDDASGTGTPAINATGLSLTSPIGQVSLMPVLGGNFDVRTSYMRDLIIRDTAGSVNNGFNGDEHVVALFAIADTTTMGWTPRFYAKFGAGILWGAAYSAANSTSTDLGSGDYTLEGFFRLSAIPSAANYSTIFSKWDAANNKRSFRLIYGGSSFNANCLQFDTCTDGTSGTISTKILFPWSPDLDIWYHIALVRVSSELLLFVNGQQLGLPIADSSNYYVGTEPLGVGAEIQGTTTVVANTSFSGWMDETRITIGNARYNASFAVPSSAFPRGSGADPHWADVALLAGYDSTIQDESSFARTLTAQNGSFQFNVPDGSSIGNWSTIGLTKATPDDNTFMSAPFTAASGVLTLTTQPANNNTVTVGTKDGTTAAVYTFKTAISTAFDVLIDTTAQNTLLNLFNAINAGTGAGTKYGTGTTANFDVTAIQLPAGQLEVNANTLGTAGNSIATSATGTAAVWGGTTLSGGANIPGPSDFKVQRPPPHTTIISAVQLNARMFKSDAGPCTVETGLVGPLGGVTYGTPHPLTVSASFYGDIIEADPDTAGPITPTTIVNGAFRLNRTA